MLRRQVAPKILDLMGFIPLLVLAAGLRLVLLVLKPIVHIRFGQLHSFQIGAYGIPMEAYFCQRDAGVLPKRSFDIFYHYVHKHFVVALEQYRSNKDLVCNEQLDKMITAKIRVLELAQALDRLNCMIGPGKDTFRVTSQQPYDQWGRFRHYPAHLSFSAEEEELGQSELKRMGMESGAEFVCFHARDGQYIFKAHPRVDSLYGEWGAVDERNASIQDCVPAAEEMTKNGYYAIRVGKFVMEPIANSNPMVIDYASNFHSDFMDIYLSAKCKFFLSTNSGIIHTPTMFRTPLVLANIYPMACVEEGVTYQDHVFTPKLLYSGEKGRLLSFREIFDLGLSSFYLSTPENRELYSRMGLKIIENTAEEITEVTMEMYQRINSTYETAPEDEELQARFWHIIHTYPEIIRFEDGVEPNFRIGAGFLRRHPELLD